MGFRSEIKPHTLVHVAKLKRKARRDSHNIAQLAELKRLEDDARPVMLNPRCLPMPMSSLVDITCFESARPSVLFYQSTFLPNVCSKSNGPFPTYEEAMMECTKLGAKGVTWTPYGEDGEFVFEVRMSGKPRKSTRGEHSFVVA